MKKTIVIAILLTFISSVTRADDTNLSKISYEAGIATICANGVFKEGTIEGWLAEDGLIPFARHLSTIEVMLGFEDLTGWYQNNWVPTMTALNESYKLGELYSQKDPRMSIPYDSGSDDVINRFEKNRGEGLYYCAKAAKFFEGFMIGHKSQR